MLHNVYREQVKFTIRNDKLIHLNINLHGWRMYNSQLIKLSILSPSLQIDGVIEI